MADRVHEPRFPARGSIGNREFERGLVISEISPRRPVIPARDFRDDFDDRRRTPRPLLVSK